MRSTTSSELVEWSEYLNREEKVTKKDEYYWAQIICEIRRTIMKHPEKARAQDFLLKFQEKNPAPMDPKTKMSISKSFWKAVAGVK